MLKGVQLKLGDVLQLIREGSMPSLQIAHIVLMTVLKWYSCCNTAIGRLQRSLQRSNVTEYEQIVKIGFLNLNLNSLRRFSIDRESRGQFSAAFATSCAFK
jgi:hypothetical protein